MNKKQIGLQIIFWGSVWGLQEVLIDTFYIYNKIIPRSILLGVSAIFILAIVNRTSGDYRVSIKIGLIAALYKFLNVLFFPCQFFAVMLFGMFYQIQGDLARKMKIEKIAFRGLFVIGALFVFNLVFAVAATYIFKYQYWLENSSEKIFRFIFLEGSITALVGFFSFQAGDVVGRFLKPRIEYFAQNKSKLYAFSTAALSSIVLILMFVI